MPFSSALDSGQYDSLRGTVLIPPTYAANEYAIFCPNTVVFQALVNGSPTGTSFAQVGFDTVTVGAYTDIVVGQTVLIGTDSDIRNATFVGRVRKAPTSSILYIQETSASILNNANIWVIDDYRVWDRLARQSGSTQLKDYDLTFTTPAPLIYGLQSAYAGIASGTPEVLELSFTPSGLPITSGATITASWVWTVPSGMTITVGSSTTQNITAEFDAGFAGWVSVQVNDSNSKSGYFHFFVGVAASDLSNVVNLNIVPGGISGDENGWTAGVEAFAGIDTLLDNTLVVLFDTEYYNGEQTSILSNVKLVGRIRKESNNTVSDTTYSQLKKATLDIEGTLAQFGRIEHLPFTLLNKASPTKFDEITNLTLWRGIAYTLQWHTTYLTLHSLTFDSTDATFLYLGIPTQGGNILSVIQDIATANNATIESAPQGETRVYRNGVYLTGAQRAALVTVADFTMQDLINIDSLSISEVDVTGKIQGSGGFYNSISGKVTPLLSLAPGVAQGVGEGINTFARQVLAANVTQAVAQSELNTRTGHEFAAKRDEGISLTVSMPPGYNFLVPSRSQWYTWTIDASDNTGGRIYTTDTRWQLRSVAYQHDNTLGTKSPIQATFELETSGTAGQTVVYPPQTAITPILPTVPTLPPFPTFPPPPTIILPPDPTPEDSPPYIGDPVVSNGNTVWIWTAAQLWGALDLWLTNTPGWTEITPDDLTLTCVQPLRLGSLGLYAILNDGTDSVFAYTPDGTGPGAVWTFTAVTNVYTKIRVGSTQGEVYLLSNINNVTVELDVFATEPDHDTGLFLSIGDSVDITATGTWCYGPAPTFCTDADGTVWLLPNSFQMPAENIGLLIGYIGSPGWFAIGTSFSFTAAASGILHLGYNDDYFVDNEQSVHVTIDVNGGGTPIILTRYSTDYGATFATPETAGDSPGLFAGFDTQKIGPVALVGTLGQVMKASAGSAWAAYGDPMPTDGSPSCIWIPRYKSGGAANSGANPDYYLASTSLATGDESVWYVSSSGTVFTSITPTISSNPGLAVSADCLTNAFMVAGRIAAVLDFDGTRHMVTSVNAGGAYSDRGAVAADASYIRYRPSDPLGNQIYLANGSDGIIISPSHGSNLLTSKAVPTTDPVIGLEAF